MITEKIRREIRFQKVLAVLLLLLAVGMAALAYIGIALVFETAWLEFDSLSTAVQIPPHYRTVSVGHLCIELLGTLWEARVHFGMLLFSACLVCVSIWTLVKLRGAEAELETEE